MHRERVWPDFDDAWILHEDVDLIAVHKPPGIPSQSADPERPDDLVTRLKAHLAGKGVSTYLGVHQRLDRDTSGVLVMARRKEANASLAAQFEGRKVQKVYRACVTGWPGGRKTASLEGSIAQGDEGRMRVLPRGHRGGLEARTKVVLEDRKGDRALVELSLETGRTHQARVHLANEGAPVAGDVLYGGAAAPRLLLHAASLTLLHPGTGKKVTFTAPTPPDFDAWIANGDAGEGIYDDDAALARVLGLARERRFGLGRNAEGPRATTMFRLVNESGDALPRLAVDVYGDHLVAQLYDGTSEALPRRGLHREDGALWTPARRERVLDALAKLGFDGVYLKVRPRQANLLVDTRREDLAPKQPVRGTPAVGEIEVFEEGIPYGVRLGDGLATGIYLDQRGNRRRVREMATGKRVLNLFAYTCAFSVAAAKGGATHTVSVDAAAVALERGRANFVRAGLDPAAHAFVADDAVTWMARAKAKGDQYDLVLFDPPSFATTKKTTFAAESDYAEVAALAVALLTPSGVLLACTNHRKMLRAKFRRYLHEAARLAGRHVRQLKDLPDPLDYPAPFGGEATLKSALLTVDV